MKATDFIRMIMKEPLERNQIGLLEMGECSSFEDFVKQQLDLDINECEVRVKKGYDTECMGMRLVGMVHETETDYAGEDVRWAAGYHPEVEIVKHHVDWDEYWCLYDLGSCYD